MRDTNPHFPSLMGGAATGGNRTAAASLLGSLVAGALIGAAVTVSIPFDLGYVVGGVALAIPVGLALGGLAAIRPQVSALALVELLVFAAVLFAESMTGRVPDPLGIALPATVLVGAVAVVVRRATVPDVLIAIVVGCLGAALMYEVVIPLHHVL